MNIRTFLLLTLTYATLMGCKHGPNEEANNVYFGGEIIHPNTNYVVLTGPDDISDTLMLDDQNRFIKKLPQMQAGLYTFTHGGEYQRILLEPKDSVMVRLNTMDFDESMVFTGEGAKKNNYLIAAFLSNEVNNKKYMRLMWDMEPSKFEEALTIDRDKKLEELEQFLSQKNYSDLFKSIAESSINYDYYYNKELYPFGYYGYNNLIHYKDLPENFYSYRATEVDYNNEALTGVIPYYRFLFYHFNNLALAKYYQNATHNVVFDKKSAVFNLEKLRLMDSLVSSEKIKNHLLSATTRDFIISSEDRSEINEMASSFMEKSSNASDKEFIEKLVTAVNRLKPGNELPNIALVDISDQEIAINSLIKKPTVIYFWSSNLPVLLRNSHYKAKSLQKKFPDIDFIAININGDGRAHWKNSLKQYHLPTSNEYQFLNRSEAISQFLINSVNRSILVNGNGKIVNSNGMLFSSEFEGELASLSQKK